MASKVTRDSKECWQKRRQRSISFHPFFSLSFHFHVDLHFSSCKCSFRRRPLEGEELGVQMMFQELLQGGGGVGGTDLQYLLWKWSSPTEILFQLFFSNHPPPVKLILLPGPARRLDCSLAIWTILDIWWKDDDFCSAPHRSRNINVNWGSRFTIWQNTCPPSDTEMCNLSPVKTASVL